MMLPRNLQGVVCFGTFFSLCLIAALAGSNAPAFAQTADGPIIRLRGILLDPSADGDFSIIGGDVDMSSEVLPEADVTWFLTDRLAIEISVANPAVISNIPTDVTLADSTLGELDVGRIHLFTTAATLQYHFAPEAQIRPYVGAGINYTFFYDHFVPEATAADVSYNDNFGVVFQAGFDVPLGDRFSFNLDVKRLFLRTDIQLRQVGAAEGATLDASVGVNSWMFGTGFGYRF